ncbi:S1 family peptidase [Alishewanella sp. d11]|uniref:S1 family peptidase n=1 Tax=Alishewanella sp. d11 TaxID=3414030 RepID=UPI003BF865AC
MLLRGVVFSILLLAMNARADVAQQVFSQYQEALLEVQVVERQSQQKSSFGSGFYVAPELVVTNFHVIANYIHTPDSYQLIGKMGEDQQPLQVLAVDVVNDLALLQAPSHSGLLFDLAANLPEQGEAVFSLGNPHGLGMVVVPGTYNGLKKQSFYPRLHVTGSLNSGMSGGPSVNAAGQVVGVNVATRGNQVAFMVPLAELEKLLSQQPDSVPPVSDFTEQIRQQLIANQQQLLAPILESNWVMKALGRGQIPESIAPFLTCWGNTNSNQPKHELRSARASCALQEYIFISSDFFSGTLEMQFEWVDGNSLPLIKFNRHYAQRIAHTRSENPATPQDVSEFNCRSDIVALNPHPTRVVYCVRSYKNYEGLYDVVYAAATLATEQQGFISRFALSGVTQDSAEAFSRKFMETVVWQ